MEVQQAGIGINGDGVAFLDKGYSHIHHVAFELTDWGEMRVALDHLGQHRRPIAWGPGRHTMAQNLGTVVALSFAATLTHDDPQTLELDRAAWFANVVEKEPRIVNSCVIWHEDGPLIEELRGSRPEGGA